LKSQKVKAKKESKELNKMVYRIRRLQEKVQKLNDDKKISKTQDNLDELESIRAKHDEDGSLLEKKITKFAHEIHRESKLNRTQLMLKLSHMQLLLERSRNIELKDIYRN
jgi:type I site-specific restriction endonuclease